MRPLRVISLLSAAALLAGTLTAAPATADTPFEQRYQVNQQGGVVRAANSVVTCKVGLTAGAPPCATARAGGNAGNNSYAFEFIDTDGDPSTFDSSSADLTLPAKATVTHAQLYWGADLRTTRDTPGLPAGNREAPDISKRDQVRFKVPGGAYEIVTADALYDLPIGSDPGYQARADVTGQVQAAGGGTYTLADVQAALGSSNLGAFGGWTLVVAYQDPNEHLRNITIYDGLRLMERFRPPITVDLAGFTTPATGTVHALLGAVAYDGDKSGTGDHLSIKTQHGPLTDVSDAVNPAANVFSSTISTEGVQTTSRDPAYLNTLGYDSDVFDVSKAFRHNDKSLELQLTTNNENYAPGVIFMQIDLYEAHAGIGKKATVVGGGNAEVGSTLEYTINVESDGDDNAANVTVNDAIPANTTYVPDSLKVNGSGRTDASGDDSAEFDTDRTVFRLGEMPKGAKAELKFRVTVDAGARGTLIDNTAKLTYEAKTTGTPLSAEASAKTPVRNFASLVLTKKGPATARPGRTATYTIEVTNRGPDTASAVTVEDRFTASTTPTISTCTTGSGTATCDLGDLPAGTTRTLTIAVQVPADAGPGAELTNTAAVSTATLDPDDTDNKDTVTTTVIHQADVSLKKTGPRTAKPGQRVDFTITAANQGPDPALVTQLSDIVPVQIRDVTWTCTPTGAARCLTPSGTGNGINALVDLPVGGRITLRVRGVIGPGATGKNLRNTARLTLPPSVTDPSPGTSTTLTKVTSPKPPKIRKKRPRPPHTTCRGCYPAR